MPRSVTRCAALGSLALFASCTADDRGLSFELGTSMGSSTTGATGGAGHAGSTSQSGKGGATTNEGAGENAGGSEASAGAGADNGGAGASSGSGTSGGSTSGGSTSSAGSSGAGTSGGSVSAAGTTGSGGTLGGHSGSSTGGTVGEAGAPFDGPCGDLNRNLVDDCAETLVQNSRFETAAAGWEPEGSLQQTWVTTNADPGRLSGSLSLRNTAFIAGSPVTAAMGSRQCLVAWGGDTYDFAAKVFIASGQGSGAAAIDLVFFGNDGCDGTVLGGKRAASVEIVDAWRTARGEVQIPAGTRSVWVRLTVGKPLAQASFGALFDDVLVTKK